MIGYNPKLSSLFVGYVTSGNGMQLEMRLWDVSITKGTQYLGM